MAKRFVHACQSERDECPYMYVELFFAHLASLKDGKKFWILSDETIEVGPKGLVVYNDDRVTQSSTQAKLDTLSTKVMVISFDIVFRRDCSLNTLHALGGLKEIWFHNMHN